MTDAVLYLVCTLNICMMPGYASYRFTIMPSQSLLYCIKRTIIVVILLQIDYSAFVSEI